MAPVASSNGFGLPQSVQEMVVNGYKAVPERYLNNKSAHGRSTVPLMEAPTIDLSLLSSSSPSRAQELAKLSHVLRTWGCFQLVNHGMTVAFLDQVRRVTKEFFGLPSKEKLKYGRTVDGTEGYGTDNAYHNHTINWNDRLHLVVHPLLQRQLKFWPNTPLDFGKVVDEFTMKSKGVVETLLKAMAISLNLEEKCFLDQYGEEGHLMFGRFNYYPPCPNPEQVLGIKPHTDGTAITVLLQDKEVEALQVQKDNEWFRVPTIPHALFINVGDQMEIMSNGLFKSAYHKVTTNGEKERISLAMLCSPDPEKEIGPACRLIGEETPQLFSKVKNYGQIYFKIDPTDDKRPIDLLRISE